MDLNQRASLFILIIAAMAMAAYLLLWPFVGPVAAMSGLSLLGFTGFVPILFRPQSDEEMDTDERSETIARVAWSRSSMVACLLTSLTCVGVWLVFTLRGKPMITVDILPVIVGVNGFSFMIVNAVFILVLNRIGVSNAQG